MMEEWDDERQAERYKRDDLDEYCEELWLTLKEYEE